MLKMSHDTYIAVYEWHKEFESFDDIYEDLKLAVYFEEFKNLDADSKIECLYANDLVAADELSVRRGNYWVVRPNSLMQTLVDFAKTRTVQNSDTFVPASEVSDITDKINAALLKYFDPVVESIWLGETA